jgi:CrcB protein
MRWTVGSLVPWAPTEAPFPWATLAVNLFGCLAIGLLASLAVRQAWPEPLRLAILVGVLGGFTTFSTFGWETWSLIQAGRADLAAFYVLATNVGGVLLVIGAAALANR